jgi:enamine deaminase RidA (YjgF/YER057c/UK114 family)
MERSDDACPKIGAPYPFLRELTGRATGRNGMHKGEVSGIARIAGSNPKASFSNVVVVNMPAGQLIYVSGQLGREASGRVSEKFEEEVSQCLENLRVALAQADARLSDLLRITVYLTDLTVYPVFDIARARALGGALPASTAVQVAGLLGNARIEIEAVAFKLMT